MDQSELWVKQKTIEKGECGCGEKNGGETEDDREMMNVDVSEVRVKQKTTEK